MEGVDAAACIKPADFSLLATCALPCSRQPTHLDQRRRWSAACSTLTQPPSKSGPDSMCPSGEEVPQRARPPSNRVPMRPSPPSNCSRHCARSCAPSSAWEDLRPLPRPVLGRQRIRRGTGRACVLLLAAAGCAAHASAARPQESAKAAGETTPGGGSNATASVGVCAVTAGAQPLAPGVCNAEQTVAGWLLCRSHNTS